MKHYVLVHGAWEGAWSWGKMQEYLEKQGHKVTSVALPGSTGNEQPIANLTLENYVQTVVEIINSVDGKVVLVGHSLGGAAISQTAERIPEKLERLVYVAAFLLKSGDSVIEAMQRDQGGEFLPELIFSGDQSYATASEQTWRSKAFHDVDEQNVLEVLPLVDHPQATEPFMAKLDLSEANFGSVPKTFVRTSLDKMVSPKLQDEMLESWNTDQVHILQAGHFPTLSTPEALAKLLA